jgi:hypothetical protein
MISFIANISSFLVFKPTFISLMEKHAKLDPKTLKCIFGYGEPLGIKGYHLYNLNNQRKSIIKM